MIERASSTWLRGQVHVFDTSGEMATLFLLVIALATQPELRLLLPMLDAAGLGALFTLLSIQAAPFLSVALRSDLPLSAVGPAELRQSGLLNREHPRRAFDATLPL